MSFAQSDSSPADLSVSSIKIDDGDYRLTKDQFQNYQHLYSTSDSKSSSPHHGFHHHPTEEFSYFAGVLLYCLLLFMLVLCQI